MSASGRRPVFSLILASLMIGTLDHSSWFLAYAGMLFGFSWAMTFRAVRPLWLWVLILSLGAPCVNLLAHFALGFNPTVSWQQDASNRFMGAILAIAPGAVVGKVSRALLRLIKKPADAATSGVSGACGQLDPQAK